VRLIDGVVFGALHFQGADTAVILPVIAVFGVAQCLVHERTGSLFAVIAK
jgi:membrane protease YdiL (CAAX protease family)